jgi:hypothetical protein
MRVIYVLLSPTFGMYQYSADFTRRNHSLNAADLVVSSALC